MQGVVLQIVFEDETPIHSLFKGWVTDLGSTLTVYTGILYMQVYTVRVPKLHEFMKKWLDHVYTMEFTVQPLPLLTKIQYNTYC